MCYEDVMVTIQVAGKKEIIPQDPFGKIEKKCLGNNSYALIEHFVWQA